MSDEQPEKIIAAAIMHGPTGGAVTFTLPPPCRHHDILHRMYAMGFKQDHTTEQGFLTSTGDFVRSNELFSEDLW